MEWAYESEGPAWYVVVSDGGATLEGFNTGTLAYPDLCHLECAGPGDWEADWEKCPWSKECGATGAMKTNPELRKPYARDFGGVNIGFLDGHARWMHSEEVIAESRSHGDRYRGRLRGYGPWGPTKDAPWYDPDEGIPPLHQKCRAGVPTPAVVSCVRLTDRQVSAPVQNIASDRSMDVGPGGGARTLLRRVLKALLTSNVTSRPQEATRAQHRRA